MKCIINGKVILKDRVAEGLAIIFDDKLQEIADLNDINLSDYECCDTIDG